MDFQIPAKQPPKRSQVKLNLYKFLVARSDFDAAHSAIKLFHANVHSLKDNLYYPLFTAIVICYARPFTNNEPHGALPEKWARFEDQNLQDLHNDVMQARHELVAHSDMKARKARVVPAGVVIGRTEEGKELRSAGVGTETNYYLFRIPRVLAISKLTAGLLGKLHDEIDSLTHQLYSGMELPRAKFPLRINDGL